MKATACALGELSRDAMNNQHYDRETNAMYAYEWYLTIESLGIVEKGDLTPTYNCFAEWDGRELPMTRTIGISDFSLKIAE